MSVYCNYKRKSPINSLNSSRIYGQKQKGENIEWIDKERYTERGRGNGGERRRHHRGGIPERNT
jgi:hypothetical protein